uniref:Knottin scorpion toxin-like domain-containing protein n=1 Tax=Oryza brachyantha TaxID=4533 RepID=J3MMS4_ORYBR
MAILRCNVSRASFLVTLVLIATLLSPTVCYAHDQAKTVCTEMNRCTTERCQAKCLRDGREVASEYCGESNSECCCTFSL